MSLQCKNKEQEFLGKRYYKNQYNLKKRYHISIYFDSNKDRFVKIQRPNYSHFVKKTCNKKLRQQLKVQDSEVKNYKKSTMYWNKIL
ncbi:MAG: hypothetical protein RSC93_02635 [Erysipelotrichaceae bacterium]